MLIDWVKTGQPSTPFDKYILVYKEGPEPSVFFFKYQNRSRVCNRISHKARHITVQCFYSFKMTHHMWEIVL